MPAVHAPHDMVVAGKQYRGGEFIPGEAQDAATPEERAALGLPDHTPLPNHGHAAALYAHAQSVIPGLSQQSYYTNFGVLGGAAAKTPAEVSAAHRRTLDHLAEPDDEEPDEEDEPEEDASPTRQFADGYFDAADTPAGRLQHFLDSLDDLDPDDPAFGPDLQTAIATDLAEAGPTDMEDVANVAHHVFNDAGYDPGDPRVAAVLQGLTQLPAAPPVPFDPSKKNAYGLLDTAAIPGAHKKAAAIELLRVLGHSAEANGAAVVPLKQGGKNTLWADYFEYFDGGDHFDIGEVNAEDDTGLSADGEEAHAALFDGLSGRPMIAETSAPASAKNFGRVSAGENVAIEPDWDPDLHDVYKPVTKGWYLLRRGTANPDVESRDLEMYSFVPRSKVGQLVSLPPQYWDRMTQGLTQADADADAAEGRTKKEEKAGDTDELKRKRGLKAKARDLDRRIGATRDRTNRLLGMDARGRALEDAADELHRMKEEDELSPPDTGESERLREARDAVIRRHGFDPVRDWGTKVLPGDPRWKAENDAYFAHEAGADPDHPAAPHYDVLHDALDDLHGDREGWRDIDPPDAHADHDDFEGQAPARRRDNQNYAAEPESHRADTNSNLESDLDAAEAEHDWRAAELDRAEDAYDDHFGRMAGHLKRVRDAAAAVMPHVAADADRTAALRKVHTVATRHLKRLARAGHFAPPDGYDMAWVPYLAKIKPRGAGKKKGDQIGWRDEETGRVVYGDRKPGERKAKAPAPATSAETPAEAPGALHDRVAAVLANPASATVAHIDALAGDLLKLPRDRVREMARARGLKVGGLKHELASRLIAEAKRRAEAPKAETAPPPAPSSPPPTGRVTTGRAGSFGRRAVMDAIASLDGLPKGSALTVGSVQKAAGLPRDQFAAAATHLQSLGLLRVSNTAHGQVFEAGPHYETHDPETGKPRGPGLIQEVHDAAADDLRALGRGVSAVGRRLLSGLRSIFGGSKS